MISTKFLKKLERVKRGYDDDGYNDDGYNEITSITKRI
jgi:hypothetical protein